MSQVNDKAMGIGKSEFVANSEFLSFNPLYLKSVCKLYNSYINK